MSVKTRFSNQYRIHLSIITSLIIVLSLIFGIFLQNGQASTPKTEVKVGLVPTSNGINDNGFNELAHEGLVRAETNLGVTGTVYQPASIDEYDDKLSECAEAGNALCISVGYEMGEATIAAAGGYPAVNFATVDMDWSDYPSNLRGLVFNSAQVGYLAGSLAAQMSTSKLIGAIGGMNIFPVNDFIHPYQYGAQWTDPYVFTTVDYANDFSDPDIGAQLAQEQINRGADVIFGVGGMMGYGAILEAAKQGKWVIGVDTDAWYSVFNEGTIEGYEFLLTSAMKRVDNAVYQTIEDQVNGDFTFGKATFDLSNDGVGLAPYHEAAEEIPEDVQQAIAAVTQRIINGEIDIWEPFYKFSVFLPLTQK